jgi:hypothetical protein
VGRYRTPLPQPVAPKHPSLNAFDRLLPGNLNEKNELPLLVSRSIDYCYPQFGGSDPISMRRLLSRHRAGTPYVDPVCSLITNLDFSRCFG